MTDATTPPLPVPPSPPTPSASDDSPRELRRMVFYSLLTGLCPLIPVPFLDDWVRDLLRQRLYLELGRCHGVGLDDVELDVLARGVPEAPTAGGCAMGCLRTAFKKTVLLSLKLARKIYRKLLIFLALKECVDTFSHSFHEAYLVGLALGRGLFDPPAAPRPPGTPSSAVRVRRAMDAAVEAVDPRPIEQLARRTFAGSRRLLRASAGHLSRLARRLRRSRASEHDLLRTEAPDLSVEEERLEGLVDSLTEDLRRQDGYFMQLRRNLDRALAESGLPGRSEID